MDCHVTVLPPLPFGKGYTYCVPSNLRLVVGDFVTIPLGAQEVLGVVWNTEPDKVQPEKLRYIKTKFDVSPLPEVSRRFIEWVSNYNMVPKGAVLKMVISVPAALMPPKPLTVYSISKKLPVFRITSPRERVLGILEDDAPRTLKNIMREAGVGHSVIRGLLKAGVLVKLEHTPPPAFKNPDWRAKGPVLSEEQATIASELCDQVERATFAATVLEGVPGSGKTEVYLESICRALKYGKQALVLLPEIALSAQWLQRFEDRFGCAPALWHSDLTVVQRSTAWRAIASGEAKVIVGARSALFLPFTNLGVIIIDEEHDSSFKQEEGVIYNARDMAVVRANIGKIPIVLVSATPSLESIFNVRRGQYNHFKLTHRHAGALMPTVSVIDMRNEEVKSGNWLSPPLLDSLRQTFELEEQAMLYLNRRGYAPLTLCRTCGFRLQCSHCSTWLVEHRLLGRLQCHHCGYSARIPRECPECGSEDSLTACGPGVERIAEEVAGIFPDVSSRVITSDTVNGPTQAANLVCQMEAREIDLLIGTQMISKGYHFPYLTLVGVVDADLGLAGGDLRASERTYQLLYQVSGRAGRAARPGRVIIQTYMPDHPVIQAIGIGDREQFLSAEAFDREAGGMPPFGQLVGIIVSSKDEEALERAVRSLNRFAPRDDNIKILGPAEAPLKLLRGRHRRRFLLKSGKNQNLQRKIRYWLSVAQVPRNVRVNVDIDPYSFL